MRCSILIFTLMLAGLAGFAEAKPLFIFYDYAQPPPQLTAVAMSPQNNQQFVSMQPASVEITFSQTIIAEKSSIKVFDEYNNPVNTEPVAQRDAHMSLKLPPHLLNGTYRAEWSATCACQGNPSISGTIRFTIVE
jgi:methionine-rich copper-binding protein CopC